MNATEEVGACDSPYFGQCGDRGMCASGAALNTFDVTRKEFEGECECAAALGWVGTWPDCDRDEVRKDITFAIYLTAAAAYLPVLIYAVRKYRRRRREGKKARNRAITALELLIMVSAALRAGIYATMSNFVLRGYSDSDMVAIMTSNLVDRILGAASLPMSVCVWIGMHASGCWEGKAPAGRLRRKQEFTVRISTFLFVLTPMALVLVVRIGGQWGVQIAQLCIAIPATIWLGLKVIRWIEDCGSSSAEFLLAPFVVAECRKSLKVIVFLYALQQLLFLAFFLAALFQIFQGQWPGVLLVFLANGIIQCVRLVVQLNNIYRLESLAVDEDEAELYSVEDNITEPGAARGVKVAPSPAGVDDSFTTTCVGSRDTESYGTGRDFESQGASYSAMSSSSAYSSMSYSTGSSYTTGSSYSYKTSPSLASGASTSSRLGRSSGARQERPSRSKSTARVLPGIFEGISEDSMDSVPEDAPANPWYSRSIVRVFRR